MMVKTLVIAFGGNAITKTGQKGLYDEQLINIREACSFFAELIKRGYRLVITHGNGPQVGNVLLQNELADEIVPTMPLDVCVAQTQASIGYAIQQELSNALIQEGLNIPVVTIITRVLVDKDDPAFHNPTKPIGPFYNKNEALIYMQERKYRMVEDSGRGWRRVVPSPSPIRIIEREVIRVLLKAGVIIITSGGGGIPVCQDKESKYQGVSAVIDKDLAGNQLAYEVNADTLVMLTEVSCVSINFGKPSQQDLKFITVSEGRKYQKEGQFPPGSMGPKMEAALSFIEKGGKRAIITSLNELSMALDGLAGTTIIA